MPTNEQRRATGKRKLQRQLERRAKREKQQRNLIIAGVSIAVIAAIVGLVFVFSGNGDDDGGTPSASTSAASDEPASDLSPVNLGGAVPMTEFKAPANLGANCQYPADVNKSGKDVKPPRTGKVPTDPAQVSVSMMTDQGPVGLMLANGKAPCTVNSFISLATQGYFNDTKCHRLTTAPGLSVLQCGDPKGDGTGGPGYQFANEYPTNQYPAGDPKLNEPVIYPRGTLAMANAGPDTNSSQFFMVYRDSALPPGYTVFGTIQDDGLATLDKIAAAGVAGGRQDGTPAQSVTITSVLPD
ncbi:peptidylprolyl isomerase [Mycobacterium sp.]|uniref:peptidylprolyl isomerase n=1 Tax=Mycobacterium sp. TaxID=1785 RepID=UPI003A881D59